MTSRWLRVVCIVALVAGGAAPALGSSTGRTGLTTDALGCNRCHSGGSAPTVTLTEPTSVTPGSTSEYLLEIFEVGSQEKGGLDAGASARLGPHARRGRGAQRRDEALRRRDHAHDPQGLQRDPVSHLMCYQIKQAKGDPRFGKRSGVFVKDQFGAARLDVKIPAELCVPATKTP